LHYARPENSGAAVLAMKIVMANNRLSLSGGSERVMLDEAAWLRRGGHQVILFGRIEPDQERDTPFVEFMPPLPDHAASRGLERVRLAKEVIYNGDTGTRFRAFLAAVRPDIVHFHNIYGGLTTAVVDECKRAQIPCFITLHDYKLACPSYRMLRKGKPCTLCLGGHFYFCALTRCHKGSLAVSILSTAEAYFNQHYGKYLQAERLIAPSQFLLRQMLAGRIPADKLCCVPNGIDFSEIEAVPGEGDYCLYLGRLSQEKGVQTLLTAMKDAPARLRIVGDGPEGLALQAYAHKLELTNVSFEGKKSGQELHDLLRNAAFVVVPSEWYENASMSVLEAMAFGKPVIASRIGGLPEQVEDRCTGILFEPGNSSDLHRAIATMSADWELRRKLGRAARERVQSRFSLDRHCETLLQIYTGSIPE
jgi:glycosyltransferase involved in cell wall biosynthesis